MAFTTIQGSGANDATSFVGTSGVDNIAIVNLSTPAWLGAQGDNDSITWNNFIQDEGFVTSFQLRGGQGNDTFTAGALSLNTFVNGNAGDDSFGGGGGYTVSTVFGGQGNDTFNTAALNGSRINGNIGSDTINAVGSASSSIYGGQGTDSLNITGGHTSTVFQGDNDNDTINVGGGADAIANSTVNGNAGNDRISYNLTAADLFGTSTIFGGQGNDTIGATAAANTVGVVLSGDNGNDTVTGAAGQDQIFGGAGADVLAGLIGGDTITSGTGVDTIQYRAAGETFAGPVVSGTTVLTPGIDRILDATAGDIINYVGFTGYLSAGAGAAANTVLNTAVQSAQADNSVSLIRGDFNATTGIFTNSVTGADTLFSIDVNQAAGATAFESVALVGTVFSAANIAATAASNVTITLV